MQTEKFHSNVYEKILRKLKNSSIGLGVIFLLQFSIFGFPTNIGGLIDRSILLIVPIFTIYSYKRLSKRRNQYIEFKKDEIKFKTKTDPDKTVKIKDIEAVDIKVHEIHLKTNDLTYKVYLEDFKNYTDRIRIKELFKEIKTEPNTG